MTVLRLLIVIALVSGVSVAPPPAAAQEAASIPRVGLLMKRSGSGMNPRVKAFRQGLRDLGYVEGRDIEILYRSADGREDRLPGLVADLIRRKVDVIVTLGGAPVREARKATRTIPIVVAVAGDFVAQGLVTSHRRPGGNVTGLSTLAPDLMGKQLELFKEVVPGLSKLAVIQVPGPAHAPMVRQAKIAAPRLDIGLVVVDVDGPEALPAAFRRIEAEKVDGILVLRSGFLLALKERITTMARKAGLPTMFGHRQEVEAGGLMAYGADTNALFRGSAAYVDKILKGADPAELPVAQSMRFLLDVNLGTARVLGINIPRSILLRADKVIE